MQGVSLLAARAPAVQPHDPEEDDEEFSALGFMRDLVDEAVMESSEEIVREVEIEYDDDEVVQVWRLVSWYPDNIGLSCRCPLLAAQSAVYVGVGFATAITCDGSAQ